MAIFFFNGLGLSPGAKLVSTNGRPSIFSIIFRLFPSGGGTKKLRRILHKPVGGIPGHASRIFRAKNRGSDLPAWSTYSRILRKSGSHTKTKSFARNNVSYSFLRTKVQCPRRFRAIDPAILHTCSTCPSPGLTSGVFFCFVFFAEFFSLR